MPETKPNIVVRKSPGGSATRGGLAGVLAYVLALVASNNGIDVPAEVLAAAGSILAGGVSALIHFASDRIGV